jgi:hypothetical protein
MAKKDKKNKDVVEEVVAEEKVEVKAEETKTTGFVCSRD